MTIFLFLHFISFNLCHLDHHRFPQSLQRICRQVYNIPLEKQTLVQDDDGGLAELLTKLQHKYIFWTTSFFVVVVLSTFCSLWSDAAMFSFNMRVKSRI